MAMPGESSTSEERAQLRDQHQQQATALLAQIRTVIQDFYKTHGIAPTRRRINPLGNFAIYYGDFTYTATYITVRFGEGDGQPYLELSGKSSTDEREALAKYLGEAIGLRVNVVEE